MSDNSDLDSLPALLAGISWQDQLLQAYRNYAVVTQSIFLAADVGLFIAQTGASGLLKKLIFAVPFLAIAVLGVATLFQLNFALQERARSVDWWQRKLLQAERARQSGRIFTEFRISKEHGFKSPQLPAHLISDEELSTLLRPGKPRARRAFEVFVPGFYFVWLLLTASVVVDLIRG